MILSIPLFSLPLLVATAFIALGLLMTPISSRLGVLSIGVGSAIMGAVILSDLPDGFELQAIILFGITVVVGAWMIYVAVKNG